MGGKNSGRPPLIDTHGMGDAVMAMALSRKTPQWKAIADMFERETGRSISPLTIRRYVKEHRSVGRADMTQAQYAAGLDGLTPEQIVDAGERTLESVMAEAIPTDGRAARMLDLLEQAVTEALRLARDPEVSDGLRAKALELAIDGPQEGHHLAVKHRIIRAKLAASGGNGTRDAAE